MKILIGLAVICALIALWVVVLRPWLKKQAFAAGFFAWIEPFEIALYKKSETILWARTKVVIGVALTALTQAGMIDVTPFLPLVPEHYQGLVQVAFGLLPMIISAIGMVDERLRNVTTKPIEVVAAPAAASATIAANVAVEQTNAQAVATIEAAKA